MADITKIDTFIQSSPHPAWLATGQGHCVYANPALERLTGLNSNQIKQADWRTFLLEEDRAVATASWKESLANGTPYRVQVRMRGSDGVPECVELIAFGHKAGDGADLWLFTGLGVNGVAARKRPQLEAQLQATLTVVPAYAWYAFPSGALAFVNERNADYLGLPKDHALRFGFDTGAAWDSHIPLLHPDDREETRRVWSTCLRTGCAGQVRFRVRNAEGGYRWFLSRAEPLRTSDGTLLYWIGVNLDIDDAKRAEDALRKSEKELRDVIDTIPAAVWSALPDGSNTYMNRRFVEYSGMLAEQTAGSGWQAAIHPDDLQQHAGKWRTSVATGKPHENEVRFRCADGQYRWHLDRGVPLRDEAGNIVKWYGVLTDIEDRKRAEEALQKSQIYLAEGQRLAHMGSWAFNTTGFTYWSSELFEVHGLDPRGKPPTVEEYLALVHPEDRAFMKTSIAKMLDDHLAFDFTKRIVRSDGEIRRIRCVGVPVTQGGTFQGFLGTGLDVTEQERLTEELPGRERFEKAIREEADFHMDYRIVHPDGETRNIHLVGHPTLDPSGDLRQFVGTVMDVTERLRAEDDLRQAFDEIKKLKDQFYKENLALREEVDRASMFEEIVGTSKPVQAVLSRIAKVAPTDSTVFITGETGTGKELIARAVHKRSQRSGRAFVSVNCAAIPRDLIASELFGHEKGAFTGAMQRRLGRFEMADGGTIFLDEIGELSPETQVALLRLLQEREFERVGGGQPIRVDVRVIAATNRNLKTGVANGTFRQDLFYRLNVFPIEVPPLRERKDDILTLVEYFAQRYASRAGKNVRSIDKKTMDLLQSYDWPGNIRELQNVIERSVILSSGEALSVDELWLSKETSGPGSRVEAPAPLKGKVEPRSEREIIEAALAETRGRVSGPSGAAAKLGIPPSTLDHRIKALKIHKSQFKFRSA